MFSIHTQSTKSSFVGEKCCINNPRVNPVEDLIEEVVLKKLESLDNVDKSSLEESLNKYIDPVLKKLDDIKTDSVSKVNEFPTITKNNGITFEGGGTMSVTNFTGVFLSILKQNCYTPEEFLTHFDSIGGNSGGSWFLSMITAYREANTERGTVQPESQTIDGFALPFDDVKSMSQTDVVTFYDKFWLNVIREHLFNNKIIYGNTATDSNGIAINSADTRSEIEQLFEDILNKQNLPVEELYNLVVRDMLDMESLFSLDKFTEVVEIFGKHGIIKNIIDMLKYIFYYLETGLDRSWNYAVQDFFLYPISKALRETNFSDIQLIKDISSSNKPFTYTMSGSCLYDSFLRYGHPGKSSLLTPNRYPEVKTLTQYVTQDMIRYQWDNPFRVIKDSMKDDDDTIVVGGVMNQAYTYHGEDDKESGLDDIDVFNFTDESTNETNEISYGKGKGLNSLTSSLDRKVQFENKKCRQVCKYRTVMDASTISSSALSISNTRTILEDIPVEIIKRLFSLVDKEEDAYKQSPVGVMAEMLGGEVDKESFLLKIVGSITVGFLSRLILSNKSVVMDNNNNTEEKDVGGVSGKYFRSLVIPNETTEGALITAGILTEVDQFAQDAQIKSQAGWNGIVAPSVYESWNSNSCSEEKRFVFNAADGAPTVNNTGLLPMIKSAESIWGNKEVKEFVYFQNDSADKGTCEAFQGPDKAVGSDLYELFGLNLDPKNYITQGGETGNGIYKRSSLFGINIPLGGEVDTASTWIFGPQTASPSERQDYFEDHFVQSWPEAEAYTDYKDALTDEEWDALSRNPSIRADLKPGLHGYKHAMFKKFDSIKTGVRLARFEKVDIRRNDAMGVSYKEKCVNLTVVGTFSPIWITPLPELGTRQFTKEFWSEMKIYLQYTSLNKNEDLGTAGWTKKLFGQ